MKSSKEPLADGSVVQPKLRYIPKNCAGTIKAELFQTETTAKISTYSFLKS